MSQSECKEKPACGCHPRRIALSRAMLLLSWLSFLVFVICSESLRRFGSESLRLVHKLF